MRGGGGGACLASVRAGGRMVKGGGDSGRQAAEVGHPAATYPT